MKQPSRCYPRVRVDTSHSGAVGQAGGVLLTEAVAATGLDVALSAALAPWRKPLAIHDPGKVMHFSVLRHSFTPEFRSWWAHEAGSRREAAGRRLVAVVWAANV